MTRRNPVREQLLAVLRSWLVAHPRLDWRNDYGPPSAGFAVWVCDVVREADAS